MASLFESSRLMIGQDFAVAAWTWQTFRLQPMYIDRAFGLLDEGKLIGSIIWRDYNGYNAEFCYYAKDALSVGLVRTMARFALDDLRVERVTIRVPRSRHRLRKALLRYGAKFEASLVGFYARAEAPNNVAIQYVLFRETLLRLAGPNYVRSKMH